MHQRPVRLMTTQWTNLNCNKSRVYILEEHHHSPQRAVLQQKIPIIQGVHHLGFGNLEYIADEVGRIHIGSRSTVLIWNSHISKMGSSIRASLH